MGTYLNPDSEAMPCTNCGRDVSDLLIKSMTVDVACSCGAPIVIGCAISLGEPLGESVSDRLR
jgi:hypothetical protein